MTSMYAYTGNSDVADLLIKHGASIKNLEQAVNDGKPIICWASERGLQSKEFFQTINIKLN